MTFREVVGHLRTRHREDHHENEVEEQLEVGRRASFLVRVPARHPTQSMSDRQCHDQNLNVEGRRRQVTQTRPEQSQRAVVYSLLPCEFPTSTSGDYLGAVRS